MPPSRAHLLAAAADPDGAADDQHRERWELAAVTGGLATAADRRALVLVAAEVGIDRGVDDGGNEHDVEGELLGEDTVRVEHAGRRRHDHELLDVGAVRARDTEAGVLDRRAVQRVLALVSGVLAVVVRQEAGVDVRAEADLATDL